MHDRLLYGVPVLPWISTNQGRLGNLSTINLQRPDRRPSHPPHSLTLHMKDGASLCTSAWLERPREMVQVIIVTP